LRGLGRTALLPRRLVFRKHFEDFGQELDLHVNWSISRRLFFLGLVGTARPGKAIDQALEGDARTWSTVQASLFWSF